MSFSHSLSASRFAARRFVLIALCALLLAASHAPAASGQCALVPGDEMWLVSTRCLPDCGNFDGSYAPQYRVHQYVEGAWQPATLDEYYATQSPDALTVAHVHGNRYSESDAIERGWQTYHIVRQGDSAWSRVRMVIWSWPSDPVHGLLKDIRQKAERTDVEGYYVGYFLAGHNPDSQLSVIGHSFGARIITGALHVMAGGRLCCGYLRNASPVLPPTRAMIRAAAMNNDWLAQGHYHGRALSAVQSMRIVYNPCDRFLIRWGLAVKPGKPQALGVTGPVGYLGEGRQRIEMYNACPYIATAHFQRIYYQSAAIRMLIREHLMWRELPARGAGDLAGGDLNERVNEEIPESPAA